MADEADLAQANNEQFQEQIMKQRASQRALPRVLPLCEECEENRCFVTEKGTVTRICQSCYDERKGGASEAKVA